MGCGTSDFPLHHQLVELALTVIHQVADAIQPSHLLLSPSPAFNLSHHQGQFFASGGESIGNHIETILEIKIETI